MVEIAPALVAEDKVLTRGSIVHKLCELVTQPMSLSFPVCKMGRSDPLYKVL